MPETIKNSVMRAMTTIVDPLGGENIVAAGRVSAVIEHYGHVTVTIEVPGDEAPRFAAVQSNAQSVIETLAGVNKSTVVISTHSAPSSIRDKPVSVASNAQPQIAPKKSRPPPITLDGIGAAIAVASGKGGVGKSTIAINLAVALSQLGLKVGILDADVYGPSVPIMTGLQQKPDVSAEKKLLPLRAHGIKCMSLGFLMDANTPTVWRGPMVVGALEQLIREVIWAPLDILLLDLPPGTGDIQLSLVQKVPLGGAVIVSTPQAVALGDVRKGISLFDKTRVPICGVIENMSNYVCPKCGYTEHLFGNNGAEAMARELNLPFLGHIPLDIAIRESGDVGIPVVKAAPQSPASRIYLQIATRLAERLTVGRQPAPIIQMED